MADNKDALRALKIKTGVLTRVKKELAMYRKEVVTEGAKLEKMRSEGKDPHDIKQQDQVLGESSMMIGDCTTRMENAFNDLLAAMVRGFAPRPPHTRTPFEPVRFRFRFKTSFFVFFHAPKRHEC
jgi:tubulin-specific chaperone A